MTPLRFRRPLITTLALLCGLLLTDLTPLAVAQRTRGRAAQGKIGDYRSRNFLMHTDMPAKEAQALLKELETMLALISKYWAAPNRKLIEVYVFQDLKNWTGVPLPHPQAINNVQGGGGITYATTRSLGRIVQTHAIAYADVRQGTPKHECVHAYCHQTFSRTGPVWYSEGMAEMGAYWEAGNSAVTAHPGVVDYLSKAEPKSLNAIVNGEEFTGDSWQNYAWRWALCHLLAYNPNYAARFRPLGLSLLTNKPGVTFESVYGSMAEEIVFEYLFFLDHMSVGYRVDLTAWDWKAKPKRPPLGRTSNFKVEADHGWQPSRCALREGDMITIEADGTVQLEKKGDELEASKDLLEAVLFNEYKLSEPFAITPGEPTKIPSDGHLFVRVRDEWNSLHDNSGTWTLKLSLGETGS